MKNFGCINIVVPKVGTSDNDTLSATIIDIRFGAKSSFIVVGILSGPTIEMKEASYYITDDAGKTIFEPSKNNKVAIPKLIKGDSIVLSLEYTI